MPQVEYNGKKYDDISMDSQLALQAVNIHTFRFFPKDGVWMASEVTAKAFQIERFYDATIYGVGPKVVCEEDSKKDHALYRDVLSGKDFSSATVRNVDKTKYYRISLAVVEKDEAGSPIVVCGIIEDYDENMRNREFLQMLSDDYYSVYSVDFEVNEVTTLRMLDVMVEKYGEFASKKPPYDLFIEKYINSEVVEEERAEMLDLTSYDNLNDSFRERRTFVHDYRVLRDGVPTYIRMKAVNLSDEDTLTKMVVGFSDVSEERMEQWEHLAYKDSITGGCTYNYYSEMLKKETRKGYIVSMDVRSFKVVNSVCGIGKGDEVLRETSKIIAANVAGKGYYGHLNADHFVFYLALKTNNQVIKVMESITEDIERLVVEKNLPKIGAYFGVTKWTPGDRMQVIFSEANMAKHRIKNSKEVNYDFYREEDTRLAIEEKEIEDAFETAIKERQFEVWYQAKYNPEGNEMTGAEALIRWRKPDGTLVSPGKFIPIFEKNGMIRTLDKYVFTSVCEQQKSWIETIGYTIPISINLSRASLYYEGIVAEYKDITNKIGVPPELVPIEITESAAINNSDIKELADQFFVAGFPLHIDDFGTGYSSLSTLNMMRFDTLKLDKSLIDYIGEFGGDRLIKHTVALARDLGLHVTAEGVESEKQALFLQGIDCDSIQGFLFSRPMPTEFFEDKLKNDTMSEKYMYRKGQRFTYSMIVENCRRYLDMDKATTIQGHVAIQVNVEGEGEGAFYLEVYEGFAHVEPYEYYDRDALVIVSAAVLDQILERKLTMEEAHKNGDMFVEGDWGAALTLEMILK